ncbi:unnamed protein product [marine sediment metagenome]|uniref:Uncharacterized protein n=1 Tax=marine sediment metagenome TaxID=412755 RepID=X1H5J4_9ZZZZ
MGSLTRHIEPTGANNKMPFTAQFLETKAFDGLRTAVSACATSIRHGADDATVIEAIKTGVRRADEQNTAGVDDADSGTVYFKKSEDPGLPTNRRVYILTAGEYEARRITGTRAIGVDSTGSYGIVGYEFESVNRQP